MPFEKLYLAFFSSGKASTMYSDSSLSDTLTTGELFTCFLASVTSCVKRRLP